MAKSMVAVLLATLVAASPATAQTLRPALPRVLLCGDAGVLAWLTVEIADEPTEWARGLMYRTSLPDDQGMLFVFEREDRWAFWMRNTTIPLSVAFIAADGTIVDIQDMQPLDETLHVAAAPARMALEVNQGYFALRGVKVGDRLVWPAVARLPMLAQGSSV